MSKWIEHDSFFSHLQWYPLKESPYWRLELAGQWLTSESLAELAENLVSVVGRNLTAQTKMTGIAPRGCLE